MEDPTADIRRRILQSKLEVDASRQERDNRISLMRIQEDREFKQRVQKSHEDAIKTRKVFAGIAVIAFACTITFILARATDHDDAPVIAPTEAISASTP